MTIRVRVTDEEAELIKQKMTENGFRNMSEYIRYVAMNAKVIIKDINK